MMIKIPGREVVSPDQLHEFLRIHLGFPSYYGANLDSLWDCLSDGGNTDVSVIWIDYKTSQQVLGDYADRLFELLQDAAKGGYLREVRRS